MEGVYIPAWFLPMSLAGHEIQCLLATFHRGRNGGLLLGGLCKSLAVTHLGGAGKGVYPPTVLRISGHGLSAGGSIHFFLLQEQEDPNKMATSWPDYYIDRINSMAAVSGTPPHPGPTVRGARGQRHLPRTSCPLTGDQTPRFCRYPSFLCNFRVPQPLKHLPVCILHKPGITAGPIILPILPMRNVESGSQPVFPEPHAFSALATHCPCPLPFRKQGGPLHLGWGCEGWETGPAGPAGPPALCAYCRCRVCTHLMRRRQR